MNEFNSIDHEEAGSYHFSPEGLKLISRCPLCQARYQPFQANIVEERDDAQLVHIQCRKCKSAVVALIMQGQLGLSSVGLITDLTSDDVQVFKDADPIEEDTVFEALSQLSENPQILYDNLGLD